MSSCHTYKNATLRLDESIRKELASEKGVFGVAFKDLSTGREIRINDKVEFHAASTMKTPVMVEVYRQAAEKKISLSDRVTLKNEFTSIADGTKFTLDSADDSETKLYRHLGEQRTISELLYQMITVSSNLATNIIIEKVNPQNVMKTMREMGAMDIRVRRGVEDNKAFAKGLNNTTTAHDLLLIFEQIANGKAVNAESCADMIRVLTDQQFNEIIPAGVGPGVKVAHKTGSITGVQHDSGIVFMPDGRKYVLVILSKGLQDEKSAVKSMARVSEMIYDYMKDH
ncbi:MAG: serine hydrolase [Chitinophagales bacterium]